MPFAIIFLSACIVGNWDERVEFPVQEASSMSPAEENPTELRVLTYNIKFGGGRVDFYFDGWGDEVHMTKAQTIENMEGVIRLIQDLDPDILLTQEVDVASKRSAYVDQVEMILESTDLNYAAWVPVWEATYIPEQGIGPMKMGQAIFSKYPITSNTRVALDAIEEQDAITRTFYLDRCLQISTVVLGDSSITVLNNHPDAYAMDGTKQRQIIEIYEEAEAIDGDILVGGDFNSVPPGTLNLTDFADNPSELDNRGVEIVTYEEEGDLLMEPFYELLSHAVTLEEYQVEDQTPFFTHSVSKDVFWNRPLDYLFTNLTWRDTITVQSPGDGTQEDPMLLSDHAPLFSIMEL